MNKIPINTKSIRKLCEKYKIVKLYLFGSFANNSFTDESDMDFLVTFGQVDLYNYFDNYLNTKDELERIYNRKVDLVEEKTIKNPFLYQSINENKILLYEC